MKEMLFRKSTEGAFRPGARTLTLSALNASKRARRELLLVVPLIVGTVLVNSHRRDWFGHDLQQPVRYAVAVTIAFLGYRLARDFTNSITPWLFRRMDAATAGTIGFLARLILFMVTLLVVLRVAGIDTRTLAVGGAVFAVVFGLAAQQTLGNVIAGLVLISAQPFRVGDRVRLQAGAVGGQVEGVVASHGLLYTTFSQGEDTMMVPNNVVLSSAVVPLREPSGVDLLARLRPDVKPSEVQKLIQARVRTPTRTEPTIDLEEVDSDEVVVRICATPDSDSDGPRLADEILAAIASLAQEGHTRERAVARTGTNGSHGEDG
jgi:small-conductance mechanosensitive channel